MKRIFTFLVFAFIIGSAEKVFAQSYPTIYATKASGSWASSGAGGVWETYQGNATNTPVTLTSSSPASVPSGTHYVYIRAGHTITMDLNRNIMGMTIENTGKLLGATAGGAFTLKPSNGGTGFPAPLDYGILNNGILGQPSDAIVLEIPIAARNIPIAGSGTYFFSRMRVAGSNPNNPVIDFSANASFTLTGNYAFTALYNPNPSDVVTVNIASGKTITLTGAAGAFHNNALNSGSGFGTYNYNINGTLDLTASTAPPSAGGSSLTAISPTAGVVNINIGSTGIIKSGVTFNSNPVSPGIANFDIAPGGAFDAKLTTGFNFTGAAIATTPTSPLTRTVLADGSVTNFPVKTAGGNASAASVTRPSGVSSVFAVSVQNTFDNAPPDPSKCVQKQWNISTTGAAFSTDLVSLSWLSADNGASFVPGGSVSIGHYTGGAYEFKTAAVTGDGSVGNPYTATASGFTSYSPFIVLNIGVVPLSLTSFTAFYNGKTTDLKWLTSNEINVSNFTVEKSTDGRSFSSIASVNANNGLNNTYTYNDAAALNGSAYYRIKMNDINGRSSYSNTAAVRNNGKADIRIYPNPVQNKLVAVHAAAGSDTRLSIFSADGRLIMTKKAVKGTTSTTLDLGSLKPGNYSISVRDENGTGTQNFIRQ